MGVGIGGQGGAGPGTLEGSGLTKPRQAAGGCKASAPECQRMLRALRLLEAKEASGCRDPGSR